MAKLTNSYNLKAISPTLSKQWHPTKNGNLTPKDVTPRADQKVWWICENNHAWLAKISKRANGTGCPYCAGRAACRGNCLETKSPELSGEWHPTKNGKLTPRDIVAGSNKIVWWRCKTGHEYQASISRRYKERIGCPICKGKYNRGTNNLQAVNPKLAIEWHPRKNGKLTPTDVFPSSAKKVWWRCKIGHEWQTAIRARTNGNGCPYCAGSKASKDRNLKVLYPQLAKEWHPIKNEDLKPENILPGAHKRVWWQCRKGHEWEAYVFSRTKGNRNGCPHCYRIRRLSAQMKK